MTVTGRSAPLKCGAAVVGVVGIVYLIAGCAGILINTSPSLPLGVYISTGDPQARLAAFCPPEPYASFATRRGYRTAGRCTDGATPLMKPIIAEAGDLVELSADGISVNGAVVPNTQPLIRDSSGRPLMPWTFGRFTVAPGTVWVASSYHVRSYDSRYFGPIPTTAIVAHVRPLLTSR